MKNLRQISLRDLVKWCERSLATLHTGQLQLRSCSGVGNYWDRVRVLPLPLAKFYSWKFSTPKARLLGTQLYVWLFLHKNISTRKNKKRINRGSKLAAYKYQQIGSLALNHCSGSCLIWTCFGGIRIRSCNCRLQNPISFNNLKT